MNNSNYNYNPDIFGNSNIKHKYNFGFVITRHVNSEKTNKYWNKCVNLINHLYPSVPIVIIDDNSDEQYLVPFDDYNVTIIKSEYPKRGELLPYIYYLKYKWFESAIFIHDSLFIHKRMPFEKIKADVLPLWHHKYDKENLSNIVRITSHLKNKQKLISRLTSSDDFPFNIVKNNFNLCFGCQCYIKLSFLEKIDKKYNLINLVNPIHNRPDRCALERITGLLFHEEFPQLSRYQSMFGDIKKHHKAFFYTYDDYIDDYNKKQIKHGFVKVWTGR